jgi:hypothetical protein
LIGVANLFADLTYEGARSLNGQFLASLGASALAVGFTAGAGELLGYGLRSITGLISDRTGRYWLATITGYAVNMAAVPAMALAGNWPLAAALIMAERTGRAIRKPSTAAMLSHAGHQIGQGWVFGLNEALDQAGATIGPLIMALVLFVKGGYRNGYALLAIPAVVTVATILAARRLYPRPSDLEAGHLLDRPVAAGPHTSRRQKRPPMGGLFIFREPVAVSAAPTTTERGWSTCSWKQRPWPEPTSCSRISA